jgi:hypothetical protein
MRRWMVVVGLVLAGAGFGLGWASAQTKPSGPRLTADDYFAIQQLYGRYTHSIDHGQKDGMDYASVFLPDGILISVTPAANPCTPGAGWEAGTRDDIRGSVPDEKNVNVCVAKMVGTQKLAVLAAGFKSRQQRHIHTNFLLTPTADGATGRVYLNEMNVLVKPPVITSSGIYDDTLVRTPDGWRFKKRIITQNAVWAAQAK